MSYDPQLNKEINELVSELKEYSKEVKAKGLSDGLLYKTWIKLIMLNNRFNAAKVDQIPQRPPMNKASYKDLIYKKADSYLVPEDYDKETFRERVSLEPSDIAKLKEAYKTIEEIAAKAPASKGLSNALEALKRGMDIEVSWTSFQKALPQRMAKDQYRDQIFKKADVFPAGSPANSPIGQAVMNTVMPGVGTAAKEVNESFGKTELDICPHCGKALK